MQASISNNLIDRYSSKLVSARRHSKKIKGFYEKFFEFLVRKTGADKRVELFGSDPLK